MLSVARYTSLAGFVLVATLSCSNSMGGNADQDRIAGVYTLRSVDGVTIPAAVAPQQGCNRTVQKGIFTISPGGSDNGPQYDWMIPIPADCQPVPAGVDQGGDDVGNWGFKTSAILSFFSLMGRGGYAATLEETPGNPPAITFAYAGNSYRFVRLMRFDDPRGVVFVDVADQFGLPVAGVVLIFTFANGLEGGGTTPASGEFGSRGIVGQASIQITAPAEYSVPASQPNPISVTVADGQALRIKATLTKL
jgi:hypothetical protein